MAERRRAEPPADLWREERRCWAQGYAVVCGVDEAGAGPLAGAVYAGAVILPRELEIEGLDDSKNCLRARGTGFTTSFGSGRRLGQWPGRT